jgi:predicted ribosomally synthesized peptide with nif11-like leader
MSQENAIKFLTEVTHKDDLRIQFQEVKNRDEFIDTCQKLGYDFTHEELVTVIKEHSIGILVRRKTGLWVWLRQVSWLERN